jgi:hypothetical protein
MLLLVTIPPGIYNAALIILKSEIFLPVCDFSNYEVYGTRSLYSTLCAVLMRSVLLNHFSYALSNFVFNVKFKQARCIKIMRNGNVISYKNEMC